MKIPTRNTTQVSHEAAGDLIRKFRQCRQVSLQSLAAKLGVSIPYVSDLERGRRNWTTELFLKAEAAIRKLSSVK
jgi:transcriptional regulator with XRE-family HTH domain